MCFSAEASFAAAGLLAVVGYATIRQAKGKEQLPLALIPWLFSLQQLSEGVLWLFLDDGIKQSAIVYAAQFIYLLIAYIVILVWIPLSAFCLEQVPWRRVVMGLLLGCSVVLAVINLDRLTVSHLVLRIQQASIQYPYTDWTRGIPYILTVCLPFLFSSQPRAWLMGTLGIFAFGIALYFYFWTVASVWCFFAALISILIYWVLTPQKEIRN